MKYRSLIGLMLCFYSLCFGATRGSTTVISNGTAIPVMLTHSIDAKKAKPGDVVTARTMQIVYVGAGESIPKGSLVTGQVVAAQPSLERGQPSLLAMRFDHVVTKAGTITVAFKLRALADMSESTDAGFPDPPTESNGTDTRTLIGGDKVSPRDKKVRSYDGDVVGENRKDGVFERLVDTKDTSHFMNQVCDGGQELQSVAIYSGKACGLYGFGSDYYVAKSGESPDRGIEVDAKQVNIKLYKGSTALLEVVTAPQK